MFLSGHNISHEFRKEAFAARFFLDQGSFCSLRSRHMRALAAYGRNKERDIIASIEEITTPHGSSWLGLGFEAVSLFITKEAFAALWKPLRHQKESFCSYYRVSAHGSHCGVLAPGLEIDAEHQTKEEALYI